MHKHYTPEALAALDAEIEVAEERHSKALMSMGDDGGSSETWHDNPVFEQAKQDVDMTRTTLRRLRSLRTDAVVVSTDPPTSVVNIGTTVVVDIDDEDTERTAYRIAGHYVSGRSRTDDEVFLLATTTPLGQALVGKTEGDHVSYQAPNGKTFQAKIIKILS